QFAPMRGAPRAKPRILRRIARARREDRARGGDEPLSGSSRLQLLQSRLREALHRLEARLQLPDPERRDTVGLSPLLLLQRLDETRLFEPADPAAQCSGAEPRAGP